MQNHIQQESRRKKYWLYDGLFSLIHPIYLTLYLVISSLIRNNMLRIAIKFLRNIRGNLIRKTRCIFLVRNNKPSNK